MAVTLKTNIVILGAGISGLSTAHFLNKKGFQVLIVEKNEPGGSIMTKRELGFLIEYGPNSMLDTSPILHELFRDLSIEQSVQYASREAQKRYIVRHGRLASLPTSPMAFLKTPLFSTKAKLRLLKEPFIPPSSPQAEESLAEFVVRRLGREFLDYAIDPFVSGVYAGLPEDLSVKSGFPKLYNLEQKYGSLIKGAILGYKERRKRKEVSKQSARLFSFNEGMQTMIDALVNRYQESLYTDATTKSINYQNGKYEITFEKANETYKIESSAVVATIPAYAYKKLKLGFSFPFLKELLNIYYPPVAMVFTGYRKLISSIPLDGFGFLAPRVERRNILGVLWNSTIFSGRANKGEVALTTFVGGSRQPHKADLPDSVLTDLVKEELKQLMRIDQYPDVVKIKKWKRAIPQYAKGHLQLMKSLESYENARPGFYISGNFRGGISVSDCIKQAATVSDKVASDLKQ